MKAKNIAYICLAAAGILLPLLLLPYMSMFRDETYQAFAVEHYEQSPLAPLTYWIGYQWCSIFGFKLMSLKVLQWLCNVTGVCMGVWYFYRRTSLTGLSAMLILLLCPASEIWSMFIYNWDTGPLPFIMACYLATDSYIRRPDMQRAIVMAAAFALMILSRVPLAAAAPALMFIVIWKHRKNTSTLMWQLMGGGTTAAAIILAFIYIIYASFSGLAAAWADGNIITGHTAGHYLTGYMIQSQKSLLNYIPYFSSIPIICFVSALLCIKSDIKYRVVVYVLSAACVALYVVCFYSSSFVATLGVLQIVAVGAWLYPIYCSLSKNERPAISLRALTMLLFLVIPGVGSDHFIERMISFAMLGPILTLSTPYIKRFDEVFTSLLTVCVLAAYASLYTFVRSNYTYPTEKFGPRMSGVFVGADTNQKFEDYVSAYNKAKARAHHPVFIGEGKYSAAYVCDDFSLTGDFHFFHFLDFHKEKDRIAQELHGADAVLMTSDNYRLNPTHNELLEKYIGELGYVKTDSVGQIQIFVYEK